jgi:hypothetical protein
VVHVPTCGGQEGMQRAARRSWDTGFDRGGAHSRWKEGNLALKKSIFKTT